MNENDETIARCRSVIARVAEKTGIAISPNDPVLAWAAVLDDTATTLAKKQAELLAQFGASLPKQTQAATSELVAAWRAEMDVYLENIGGALKRNCSEIEHIIRNTQTLDAERLDAAIDRIEGLAKLAFYTATVSMISATTLFVFFVLT